MNKIRQVTEIIAPQFVMEGAGVLLRRSISPQVSNRYDPFLLFDHFAFNDPLEGPLRGFPMHPHRGIETVSYIIKGSVNHRDSLGNSGLIGPGDVQWMTAGGGILHEEMPRRGLDGIIDGFQLWVNLPSSQKMSRPRYQEVASGTIPEIEKNGCLVRVVAGVIDGVHGPVSEITANPIYLDVNLQAEARISLPVPNEHTVLVYIFSGKGLLGDTEVESVRMAVLGKGSHIEIRAGSSPVHFVLIAGAPFGEPIVPYGPFVMNTREEIQQALAELKAGTFVRE